MGVEEELKADAYKTDDGHCETDGLWGKCQTAGEFEGGASDCLCRRVFLLVRGIGIVLARCGEEEDPESAEGAHVEVEDGDAEESPTDVARPDFAEWEDGGCSVLTTTALGETIQLDTALARFVLGVGEECPMRHGVVVDQ